MFRRFLPELVQQVHVDELPDLQNEARRMMAEARSAFMENEIEPGNDEERQGFRPLMVSSGFFRYNEQSSTDASMDFQMVEDEAAAGGFPEPVCDPVTSIVRRVKRPRSHLDSGDEGEEVGGNTVQMDPDEPSPSPRTIDNPNSLAAHNAGVSGFRSRKQFHRDNVE